MHCSDRAVAAALVIAAGACSSATIEQSWRAPSTPTLTRVITLSTAPDVATRRATEDELARQLSRHGIRAVPGYTVPGDQDLADQGFDGIVTIRLVGVREWLAHYPRFDTYWVGTWDSGVRETVFRIEVSAYALPGRHLVWSATSRSVNPSSEPRLVAEVSKIASDRLASDHVIAPAQTATR